MSDVMSKLMTDVMKENKPVVMSEGIKYAM